jgi:hypothetical protein
MEAMEVMEEMLVLEEMVAMLSAIFTLQLPNCKEIYRYQYQQEYQVNLVEVVLEENQEEI